MRTLAIIGSFRKKENYAVVTACISLFTSCGIVVSSPTGAEVTNTRDRFVIFSTDHQAWSNEKIQLDTLKKILASDAVYVVNNNGYLGRTTCYEIGRIVEKKIPLYFMVKPDDLPICITEEQIVTPEQMKELFLQNGMSTALEDCDVCKNKNFCLRQNHENA